MPKMTAWRAVVEALKAEGVQRIYGLPGNPLHLVADIVEHSDIDIVLMRHEHSGVAAAYAEARMTGRPAVCFGNPGPGTTNMVTALLEATCGSLPVIALSNGTPHSTAGKGAFQELDTLTLMRPVTKWAERPTDPAKLPWVMQRAFSLAVNGRPGAVFIDIPSDIGLVETEIPDYVPSLGRLRSRPDQAATKAAATLLAAAKRPVFLCGSGAASAGATAALTALAEKAGAAVFTTPGGRGVFPESHELSLGQVGLYFTRLGKTYYDGADLVISVGSRLEEFSTGAWRYFPAGAKFVQIDADPHAIAMNWRPDVALVGDAALCLEDLAAALDRPDAAAAAARRRQIAESQSAYLAEIAADCAELHRPIRTRQIMAAINRVFGRDTILVNENGGADLWSYYWPYYRVLDPGCCVPMAEQTAMGMGVIGAIGAKLSCPDRNVVCVTGDAAFAMAMMELATAAERKLGVTWVMLNNQALGWPQYLQLLDNRQVVATDYPTGPDFVKIAEAQGCMGLLVENPADVEPALGTALAANRKGVPVLIDFRIEKHDYPRHFVDFHREVFALGRDIPG